MKGTTQTVHNLEEKYLTTEEVGFSSTLPVGNPVFYVGTALGEKDNFCCGLYTTNAFRIVYLSRENRLTT